jgi:hypothetical protein
MSRDRQLIDAIKDNLARKSTAQLQEMVQANDPSRWSAEAFEAAREVLMERAFGHATEPLVAEPDPPPPTPSDPASLAFMFGLMAVGLAAGYLVVRGPARRGEEDAIARDQPLPFGYKVAWLAVDTEDTAAVAAALGLRDVGQATWADGLDAAYRSSVFVTPPLGQWTLAVGTALFPPNHADEFVKPLLERLSHEFGDAQYFCTHRDVELHIWARARKGRLMRGYGWLGKNGRILWDEGAPTRDERDLGFRFGVRPSSEAVHTGAVASANLAAPDEGCVMQLASLWSIDPTSLDEHFKEPVLGLLGSTACGAAGTRE